MSNEGGSGCFSAVARLLLCKGHLQTHPSDHIPDPIIATNRSPFHKDRYFTCEEAHDGMILTSPTPPAAPPPGIVARLMGLESLPAAASTNWRRPSAAARDAVTRSRSVSFVDYLLHLDLSSSSPTSFSNAQHRRVRTSASFREEILAAQNHPDFFLLYLEDTHNIKASTNFDKPEKPKRPIGSKLIRRSEIGNTILGQSKQRREADEQKKQRREEARRTRSKSKEKISQKKKEQKKKVVPAAVGAEKPKQSANARGNQASSSVIVGSVSQLKKKVHIHRKKCPVKPTANQKEVMVESSFMKKLKNQKPITNHGIGISSQSSASSAFSGKKRDAKKSCETNATLQREAAGGQIECCKQPAANLGDTERYADNLAEEDMKGTAWIEKRSNVDVECEWIEEICVELGQQLLDLLLRQAVEELV